MTQKNIGVIIPYINLPEYILKLVPTIKTKHNATIFLIDQNSDEKTKIKLRHLAQEPNIKMVSNSSNLGCAGAWNMGLELCNTIKNCEFAIILNNDILLHPDAIDNMIEASEHNNITLVSAFDVARDCNQATDVLTMELPQNEKIVDRPQFSCFTLNLKLLHELYTQELNVEVHAGRFDSEFYPAYYEDNDFHYRLRKANQRAVYTNRALYYHYGSRTMRENKHIDNLVKQTYLNNQQRFINKWGGEPLNEKNLVPFGKDLRFKDRFICPKKIIPN